MSSPNEYSGLISFRMDWLDLLAVQGTFKSLLQYHSSKASVLQRSAFFIFRLAHPYTTAGKTKALTRQTFVSKVMSLFFNILSRWKVPWMEEPGELQSMVSLSRTRLSAFTFAFHFHALEKEMAAHSSVLAWRIPGTGEPSGLPSVASHRVGHDWSDLAAAAAAPLLIKMKVFVTHTVLYNRLSQMCVCRHCV